MFHNRNIYCPRAASGETREIHATSETKNRLVVEVLVVEVA